MAKRYALVLVAFVLFSVVCIGGTILPLSRAYAFSPSYNSSNLIDDPTLLDSSSMSASAIQSFLSNEGSYLSSYSDVEACDSTIAPYYTHCGQTISAAQIVFDASQAYGINPQAILATMEKEQSLVTDPSPSASQIDCAMGYNSCSGYVGFFTQVDNGAWILRYNYEGAMQHSTWLSWSPGNNYPCASASAGVYSAGLYPGNSVTFADSGGTPETVMLANAATASLYCYTPYVGPYSTTGYSGSYNFVYYFQLWFGATVGTSLIQGSGSTVYFTNGSVRYAVPSSSMLYDYGLLNTGVTHTSDSYIQSLTDDGVLTTLFTVQGDPTVYVADHGVKYGISSASVCTNWGYNCSSGVSQIAYGTANNLANGGILQPLMSLNGTIYKMQNGIRYPYLSQAALTDDGYSVSQVSGMVSGYNNGNSVGAPIVESNALVKFGADPTIYFYLNGNYYGIPDGTTYSDWFINRNVYYDTVSSYATTPPTTAGKLSVLFKTSAGKTYLLDQGYRIDITDQASDWPAAFSNADFDSIVSTYPLAATDTPQSTYRTSIGAIYVIHGGQKQVIASMNDFYELGYSLSNCINVGTETLDLISNGPAQVGEGSVFKVTGSSAIYLKGPGQSVYYLLNMSQLGQFQLTREDPVLDPSQLSSYTAPQSLSSFIALDGSTSAQYVLDANNQLWNFTQTQAQQWGITSPPLTNVTSGGTTFSSLGAAKATLPSFAIYNGTVYYGSGGVEHPIATYSSYQALGGNSSNTFPATKDFIDAAPTGSIM